MRSVMLAIVYGGVGIFLLRVFYRAVRVEWPSNYVSVTRSYGLIVNRTVRRYLLFILVPVYLVSLLVSTLAIRQGALGLFVALIVGLGHGLKNHGGPVIRTVRRDLRNLWGPDILLQLGLILLAVLAALAGGLGPGPFGFVVPPIDEFFKAIWTAVFVAVLGILVLDTTASRARPGDLYDIAMREASPELVAYAVTQAQSIGVDKDLVLAILYAENLQRPAWFRRLEYIKGRFFPSGSYGVMQVTWRNPISDKESIDLAIRDHINGVHILTDKDGRPDRGSLSAALRSYNDNPAFVELAAGLYLGLKGFL